MKIRISREQLKAGMFIERAIIDKSDKKSSDVDFIQNVLIDSSKKLKELKSNHIKFLIIDTAKAQKIVPKKKPEPEPEEDELFKSFDDELKEKKSDFCCLV